MSSYTIYKILQKTKKKHRIKKYKIAFIIILIASIISLFASDIFKIKNIDINCNDQIISQNVREAMSNYINKYYLFLDENNIKNIIMETNKNIKKVDITNKYNGSIEINIVKAESIAYSEINSHYYIINELGNISQCSQDQLPLYTTKCINFPSKDILEKFAKQYYKIRDIIRNDVSDIEFVSDDYNSILIRLYLINTNVIQIRVEDMVSQLEKDTFPYEAYMQVYKNNYIFSFEGKYVYIKKIKLQ